MLGRQDGLPIQHTHTERVLRKSGDPHAVKEWLLLVYVSAIGGAASERQPSMSRQ
jgi:hypothetical protein